MARLEVSRRGFLAGAVAGGAATALPVDLVARAASVLAASGARFFTAAEYATCDALSARILPSDDGRPGAREARAVDFIDLFLGAFDLPASAADQPAIWIRGPFSGRNPYPDPIAGGASSRYPPSDMRDAAGRRRFLPLTGRRALAWRARLEGPAVITENPELPDPYRAAIKRGLIPLDPPLRSLYRAGLAAFDDVARVAAGGMFADVPTSVQDAILARASGGTSLGGGGHAPTIAQPAAQLYPVLEAHTLQGCFALPEYGGNRDAAMWRFARWEGDTQPLGNTVYDPALADADLGPAQGRNAGFGRPGVYEPRGGYREVRLVSTPDPAADPGEGAAIAVLLGLR
ncbi:MAG TPA: gluconate 2-dehydrogenase subunit 3 family protein [Candidatus Dormibacteraeota bacterium]